TIYGEFAFGSGDPDRQSVTDTIFGNRFGADNNFLYFGYLRTGYALSPRLSNLRMLKAGLALKPLDRSRRWNLRELTTTVDLYRYYKDEPEGAVFDPQASEADDDVGTEVDLTLSWPMLSDCTLDIEYGHFIPSAAYPPATSNHTQYFAVSLTTTF
ncbi:MAG: alginate export family protein, partial [Candidatus Omnitrophica bacterium]|nr:alginate export family protein [Candidatus Omnitrophota bacterium]